MLSSLAERLGSATYQAKQYSILVNSAFLMRLYRSFSPPHPFTPEGGLFPLKVLQERYRQLLARDLQNTKDGLYPHSLLPFPTSSYLRLFPALLKDIPALVRRRITKDFKELPKDIDLERYPAYYRRTFHWQTDGYLSRESAEIYDLSVEILFGGTADIMRRQVIPPISRFLRDLSPSEGSAIRLLDVACGTGRILAQIALAHPSLRLFGLDLSPYYLQVARERLSSIADLSLVAAPAEEMPFCDSYFDILTSIHLFHELPRRIRRSVFAEMFRVLKPGGLLVIEDSCQVSESPEIEPVLQQFSSDFHEPYYKDYLRDDLATALTEAGFLVEATEAHLVAKVVIARKPPKANEGS